jgi:hypothetical protein
LTVTERIPRSATGPTSGSRLNSDITRNDKGQRAPEPWISSAARNRLIREKEVVVHPPESDLIYDWNRAGGAVSPARGKTGRNRTTGCDAASAGAPVSAGSKTYVVAMLCTARVSTPRAIHTQRMEPS